MVQQDCAFKWRQRHGSTGSRNSPQLLGRTEAASVGASRQGRSALAMGRALHQLVRGRAESVLSPSRPQKTGRPLHPGDRQLGSGLWAGEMGVDCVSSCEVARLCTGIHGRVSPEQVSQVCLWSTQEVAGGRHKKAVLASVQPGG